MIRLQSARLIERNLVLAAIVELCRLGAFVVGDVLRDFELAAVLQVRGDAGVGRAALDQAVGVLLPHGAAGELAWLSGRPDVLFKKLLQIVVARTSCSFFFLQPAPAAASLHEIITQFHLEDADEGAVVQPD